MPITKPSIKESKQAAANKIMAIGRNIDPSIANSIAMDIAQSMYEQNNEMVQFKEDELSIQPGTGLPVAMAISLAINADLLKDL